MFKESLILILALAIAAPVMAANVIGNPIRSQQSAAAEGTHVFSTAPANLYGAQVTIGTTAGYAMAFNAVAAPVDGAVAPVLCFNVPASTTLNFIPAYPIPFSTGVSWAFSTTGCFTKTASATAFFSAQVR